MKKLRKILKIFFIAVLLCVLIPAALFLFCILTGFGTHLLTPYVAEYKMKKELPPLPGRAELEYSPQKSFPFVKAEALVLKDWSAGIKHTGEKTEVTSEIFSALEKIIKNPPFQVKHIKLADAEIRLTSGGGTVIVPVSGVFSIQDDGNCRITLDYLWNNSLRQAEMLCYVKERKLAFTSSLYLPETGEALISGLVCEENTVLKITAVGNPEKKLSLELVPDKKNTKFKLSGTVMPDGFAGEYSFEGDLHGTIPELAAEYFSGGDIFRLPGTFSGTAAITGAPANLPQIPSLHICGKTGKNTGISVTAPKAKVLDFELENISVQLGNSKISGSAVFPAAGKNAKVSAAGEYSSLQKFDLALVLPKTANTMPLLFNGFIFNGLISARVKMQYSGGCVKSTGFFDFSSGTLSDARKAIFFEDAAFQLDFDDLAGGRTKPEQPFCAGKIHFGTQSFDNFNTSFQLTGKNRPPVISESVMDWCGGKIRTQPFHYGDGGKMMLRSSAENIVFEKALNFFGISKVHAPGKLAGNIYFNAGHEDFPGTDGELFTVSGDSVFKLEDAAQLAERIGNTAGLDLAATALEAFQCSSASLKFNRKMLNLTLSGRPLEAIPFVWDSSSGTLIRSGNGRTSRPAGLKIELDLDLKK